MFLFEGNLPDLGDFPSLFEPILSDILSIN